MNKRKSIVFFEFVTHFGGSNKSTIALINELRNNCDVTVLDAYGSCSEYLDELTKNGINHDVVLPKKDDIVIGGSSIGRAFKILAASGEILRLIKALRQKLKRLNPDAIWLNSEKGMFCAGRAVGDTVPTIQFIRTEIKSLKWYCIRDWKRVGMIAGNNSQCLKFFEKYSWAKDRLVVAYNGIDIDSVANIVPACDLPRADAELKVVMPATLLPLKAHVVAIKAVAKLAEKGLDIILWICGDVPNNLSADYKNQLISLCNELKIQDRIFFLGWRNDVLAIMKQADVMMLTSNTEGLPRSILEAMALGKPVIATRVGGIPELIRNDIDGILVEKGDFNAAAESLLRLRSPSIRRKMGLIAQERVKVEFTIKKQADVKFCIK